MQHAPQYGREGAGVGIIELIGALPRLLEHREGIGDLSLRVESFAMERGGLTPMRSVDDGHEAPGCLQHLVGAHSARRQSSQLIIDVNNVGAHRLRHRKAHVPRIALCRARHCDCELAGLSRSWIAKLLQQGRRRVVKQSRLGFGSTKPNLASISFDRVSLWPASDRSFATAGYRYLEFD